MPGTLGEAGARLGSRSAANKRKVKTDQERAGRRIGIFRGKHVATCPARLKFWLKARGGEAGTGPLFVPHGSQRARTGADTSRRHGQRCGQALREKLIGLDPADYGGQAARRHHHRGAG